MSRYVLVVSILWSLNSCATDQAAKVRNDRSATVGVWGAAYRPNSSVGIVANYRAVYLEIPKDSHVAKTAR